MEIPIQTDQHYQNHRGDVYTVKYTDGNVVLLFDGHNYRLENEVYFETLVDEGKFELYDDDINTSKVEIPLRDIDHIGETTAESMERGGYTTPVDIDRTSDEKLLEECRGLGEAGLDNIYGWIENNTTDKTIKI